MKYKSLTDQENELLTEDQKRELAAFDNEVQNSNNRYNRLVQRRLFDGEEGHDPDSLDYCRGKVGRRLIDAHEWEGEDDYSEESSP